MGRMKWVNRALALALLATVGVGVWAQPEWAAKAVAALLVLLVVSVAVGEALDFDEME